MHTFTVQQAQAALAAQQNNAEFTVQQIRDLLGNASVTFANVVFATQQQNAAAYKSVVINKVTNANVILCSNIHAHTSVYANRVKRSAAQFDTNNRDAIDTFVVSDASYTHTDCYSIVQNKRVATKFYLYAIFNTAQTVLLHNNNVVTAQYAQQFLTPSALAAQHARATYNKINNITHDVVVRTIAISNLVGIRAHKQILALA